MTSRSQRSRYRSSQARVWGWTRSGRPVSRMTCSRRSSSSSSRADLLDQRVVAAGVEEGVPVAPAPFDEVLPTGGVGQHPVDVEDHRRARARPVRSASASWPARRRGLSGVAHSSVGRCGRQPSDLLDHRRVGQRGGVAQVPALGHVAEQPPHDLPAAGLGQFVGEDDRLRAGRWARSSRPRAARSSWPRRRRPAPAPARRVTKAMMAWPVVSSLAPTTAASATAGWSTSADSTSVVEIRWPDTFITSSTRPSSQR